MLKVAIDRASGEALHRQIYNAVRCAIIDGRLRRGMRLPSMRSLARRLRVSRNTVLNSYEALAVEGLLIATIGSGTRVHGLAGDDSLIPRPKVLRPSALLRQAHFPSAPASFEDSEGNVVYAHC